MQPLLDGEIRSCFSMTEPEVAGSDPTTLQTRAELDGDEWVINGHKWFTSGAVGAELAIVMVRHRPRRPPVRAGEHDPRARPTTRASTSSAPVSVMGHAGGPRPLRDPLRGLPRARRRTCSARAGRGFVIAQDRLGPGRIHHCMRAIGTAERAIELMCRRANEREAFGGKLADKQFVQDFIAHARGWRSTRRGC